MFNAKNATILAFTALVVSVFGSTPLGHAAGNLILAKGSVGTKQLKKNAVTSAKVKNGSLLRADFKRGQLLAGARGPVGPTGATGPAGPAGPTGSVSKLTAVVDEDGTLVRGQGVTLVRRSTTGGYEVIFNRDVRQCTPIVSPGRLHRIGVSVAPHYGNVNGYWVSTFNLDYGDTNGAFQIVVVC